jgi:hypothetical protein
MSGDLTHNGESLFHVVAALGAGRCFDSQYFDRYYTPVIGNT